MSIYYARYEDGHRYELSSPHATNWSSDCDSDSDLEFLAEEAAADFHSERDGWESSWPLTIFLYDGKDGPEIARFTVEREYEPTFSAERVSAPQPQQGESNGN